MKKKCDICRKEFENSGVILAKKKDGLDLQLCPECTKMVCNKIEEILLKRLMEGKNIDSDAD